MSTIEEKISLKIYHMHLHIVILLETKYSKRKIWSAEPLKNYNQFQIILRKERLLKKRSMLIMTNRKNIKFKSFKNI